ncbi:MAG: DUF3530 family protein [Sulfuriflexus sp.]|nr:DUF3530 family protein [Sulfuriflexus sp.]
MKKQLISLLIILLSLFSTAVFSSDAAKEKRWANQVVDGIIVGDAVWLEAGGSKFLGIYTENDTDIAKGAVLLLHGSGVHPNWPDIIQPLRSELPEHGWTTLSIQMPILANDAKYVEYAPLMKEAPARIDAAINYLNSKFYQNIIIVAHSLGNTMANSYLIKSSKRVRAYVAIGMDAYDGGPVELNNAKYLANINLPILDIYGSQDLDGVLSTTKQRQQAARKAENENYRQIEVLGANHFFNGQEEELIRQVKSWLSNHAGRI